MSWVTFTKAIEPETVKAMRQLDLLDIISLDKDAPDLPWELVTHVETMMRGESYPTLCFEAQHEPSGLRFHWYRQTSRWDDGRGVEVLDAGWVAEIGPRLPRPARLVVAQILDRAEALRRRSGDLYRAYEESQRDIREMVLLAVGLEQLP